MEKDVLILSYQNVFDKVACKIIYQNEDVFERGEFIDEELRVASTFYPDFTGGRLYLKGLNYGRDNHVFTVEKCYLKNIEERVEAINRKYGKKTKFRPKINGTPYWCIDFENQDVAGTCWCEDETDLNYYKTNNCFETQEQAEEALERVKKALAGYQEELLKG